MASLEEKPPQPSLPIQGEALASEESQEEPDPAPLPHPGVAISQALAFLEYIGQSEIPIIIDKLPPKAPAPLGAGPKGAGSQRPPGHDLDNLGNPDDLAELMWQEHLSSQAQPRAAAAPKIQPGPDYFAYTKERLPGIAPVPSQTSQTGQSCLAAETGPQSAQKMPLPASSGPMAPYENPTAWIATARTLAELEAGVASCQLCPLGQSRKRTFFGRGGTAKEGTGHVPVMLILDPPDINDAEAGQTPSGPLATLLDNIVRGGLKMSPEEIYVTPAVKCPPEDPDEILPKTNSYCRLIALKEIELAAPLEIIALGHTPSRILTGVDLPFYRILQNPRYKNIRVRDRQIPLSITFGLRSMDTDDTTDLKKDAWSKIKQVLRRLGRLP